MGKLIAKQIRGMNLWAKVALTVLFTFALSVFMYEGWYKPTSLQAAPGILDAWTTVSSTAPANISGTVTTSSVTASADATNTRLFLVAVALEVGTGNTTVSTMNVSYGGVALTPIGNTGATSAREHVYMGYLKDSQIPAGANAITVQYGLAANTVTGLHVNWATYTGVDQTTPINASNAVATALATVTFGTTINYVANGLTLYCAANGGTPTTMTPPSGFTQDLITTTSAQSSFVADTATHATAGSYASTTTVTFAGTTSTRSGIVVASLRPSAAVNTTAAGTATAVAAGSSSINVSMPFTNDANNNSTYTIDYKLTSSGTWTNWVTAAAHATSPYTNTITGLTPATSYDVRVTYNDADGVTGTNPQTIAGVVTAAENRTTAGTATATAASSSSINVSMPFTTDANNNNTYTVEYKLTSSGTWSTWVTAAAHATSPYTTTITGLTASTSYDVRATYNDADGVIGTSPQTITGVVTSAAAGVNSTTAGTASVAPGSTTIQVTAPYTNDANANNTLKVEWGTGGTYTLGTQTLTHAVSPYAYTINGLTASTAYNVRVTYQDADTVTGTAVQTFTPTTLAFSSPLMHTAANVNPADTKGYGATWGSTFTCETCHAQGTSNVKLIGTSVTTPNGPRNVVFTRMTSSSNAQNGVFGNDARTYSGNGTGGSSNICEVCHRKTQFHRYSTNAPTLTHYNNQVCLPCHPHSAGFKGSGHSVPMYATAAGHTSCASGIGCHANSNPAAPYPTAGTAPDCRSCHAKGDPTTANIGCGSCHGAANGNGEPVGTVHPDAAGSHAAHTSIPTACTYCHDTGGTGGNADHGKGNRGANPAIVNLAASFTWNGTSCSTTTCHANVYGAGSVASPAWGTSAGCTACHSVAIGANGPATGSHTAHAGTACTQCHAAGTTATTAPSTGHANGNVDVLDGYPTTVAKHAAGTYTGTCTTASCHSNVYGAGNTTTPVWGTSAGCTACHSVAIGVNGPATGSHDAHAGYLCTNCHAAGTTATTSPTTGHANGNVDVLDGYPATVAKHAAGTYTGNCANIYCHSNGTSVATTVIPANTSPVWGTASGCTICHSFPPAYANNTPKKNSHAAGGHSISCDNCHYNTTTNGTTVTTVANHVNKAYDVIPNTSKGIAFTYTFATGGGTCATVSCHGTAQWGVTVMDCVSCHTSAVNITKGPLAGQSLQRRAIQPEFLATWSHKNSDNHTVYKQDCIVCHMEGNKATGGTSGVHGDGFVNLRDADTGVEITNVTWNGGTPGAFVTASGNASFSRFSRNLSVTMEADPAFLTLAAIEVNHCLSCHDSDGALSTEAQVPTTGTAGRPFGVAVGATSTNSWTVAAGNTTSNVVNVASSFDTTNASYHPVLGKQNNGFAGGTMMKAPWNGKAVSGGGTTNYGFLISCWDCHADVDTGTITDSVTAHGNGTTIRANVGSAHPNLCTKCHADAYGTGTSGHGTGSAAQSTSSNIGNNHATCQNCHSSGSINNMRPWRGVDAHGFNLFAQVRTNTTGAAAGAATWTSGAKPWAFIRTNNLSGWRPAKGTGLTDASNGTCGPNGVSPCSNSHGTYTPGGAY